MWNGWSPSISQLLSRSSHHIIFLPCSLPITPSFCTPFSQSRHHIFSLFTLTYQYLKGKQQSFQLSTLPGAIQRPFRGNLSAGLPGKSLCARIVPLLSSTSGRFLRNLDQSGDRSPESPLPSLNRADRPSDGRLKRKERLLKTITLQRRKEQVKRLKVGQAPKSECTFHLPPSTFHLPRVDRASRGV